MPLLKDRLAIYLLSGLNFTSDLLFAEKETIFSYTFSPLRFLVAFPLRHFSYISKKGRTSGTTLLCPVFSQKFILLPFIRFN